MKIREIITESRRLVEGRIVHPEDMIIDGGIQGAQQAVAGLAAIAKGQEPTTIKWDGFPALVFGRNVDGQLVVADKHMFEKKSGEGRVTSAQAFQQYDVNRGADRADLYGKVNVLWPALEKVIPRNFRGYYMGDLLYAGKQEPVKGVYTFKPNTVTYRVRADSAIGKKIEKSLAGIAVHTFIADIGEPDQPLQGLGDLPDSGPIWFVTGEMKLPKVSIDTKAVGEANSVINKYAGAVTKFIADLNAMKAKGVLSAISPYITSRIASGSFDNMLSGFYEFLPTKLSAAAQAKLLGDKNDGFLFTQGRQGLEGIFAIWVTVYNLKMNIKQQIDAGMGGSDVQASIGNEPGHEGYVVGGGEDKFKLIDRLGFSRANFAKNG
jgi:Family of unknown function (DUF6267)